VKKNIEKKLEKINFSAIHPDKVIATAGTATTLAAIDLELEHYDYRKTNGHKLHISKIKAIFEKIIKMNMTERQKIKGLEKGREDSIIPGIIIVMTVMAKLNTDNLIISDFGVREGIVIAASNH
jgi:exopolyphosphatase/guanosine-5'-triphosphate,3'-diphosphate pyrophosphatase